MSFSSKARLCFFLPFVLPTGRTSPICSLDQFACLNGPKCIPIMWLCDGARDCPDGSDETHFQCHSHLANITCLGNQPDCLHGGVPRCIPNEWLCDGHQDCDHGEDETGCGREREKGDDCGLLQFRCGNRCIFRNQLCQEVHECKGGTDDDARLCGQLHLNKTEDKTGQPEPAVVQVRNNSIEGHRGGIARSSSTIPFPSSAYSIPSNEEKGFTTTPETTAGNWTKLPTSQVNKLMTTSPSAPSVSLLKFFNYSLATPTTVELSQPQSYTSKVPSINSSISSLTSLAKVFRSQFSASEEPLAIRRLPERKMSILFKREANMLQANETGREEVVYDFAEERSESEHENPDGVQKQSKAAPERIKPELQPVKSVVGEPIRPVNL